MTRTDTYSGSQDTRRELYATDRAPADTYRDARIAGYSAHEAMAIVADAHGIDGETARRVVAGTVRLSG